MQTIRSVIISKHNNIEDKIILSQDNLEGIEDWIRYFKSLLYVAQFPNELIEECLGYE